MKIIDTNGWEWYCPDNWVLHGTISLTSEDEESVFYKASNLILHDFNKICGEFIAIGLVNKL